MIFRVFMPSSQELHNDEATATIFVVDDDAAVRRSLTRLLRSAGWNAEAFASAGDLLERAPFTGPGCVVLDVNMPGMNGLELQESMTGAGITLPVVFLTGKGDISMSVQAMKHGAVDFLVKPVEEAVLFQALEEAIRRQAAEADGRRQRDSILARLALLSDREREVLDQVIQGRLNKQIAYDLGIVEKTVKAHRGRIMEKMQAHTIAELVHLCVMAGMDTSRPAG
jgi:FixJ family two-component response regulator